MQALLGAIVFTLTVVVFVDHLPGRSGRPLLRPVPVSPRTRVLVATAIFAMSVVISVLGMVPQLRAGLFAYCAACPVAGFDGAAISSAADFARVVLEACWYYAATVIPVFLAASLLSGLLATRWKRLTPRNAPSAFLVAAVLPVCSCGVIPVAKGMLSSRGAGGVRTALVFLATAPLLSPVIILIGLDVLGPVYVLARIAGAAIVAVAVALTVSPHVTLPVPEGRSHDGACDPAADPRRVDSAVAVATGTVKRLYPYVLYGLCIGSLVAAAVTPEYMQAITRSGVLSLAATTLVGIPINMCAGEEVLLVAPLVARGLPLGHALAFSLASTGICASSIPLLFSILGRRGTVIMIATYLVAPFVLGLLLNLVPLSQLVTP